MTASLTISATAHIVYGTPPASLAETRPDALQVSPLRPGAGRLEDVDAECLQSATILAPPGSVERRFVLAQALRALAPGCELLALAPRDRGGARLRAELEGFGCMVAVSSKSHHRIASVRRPEALKGLAEAIAAGALRQDETLGLWTQAGVFSADRIDPGSALLLRYLPDLSGAGADLGAGLGILSRALLREDGVRSLHLVEIDRRAVDAARRNVEDPRARFHWADARSVDLAGLDFVVTNPPFHAEGEENRQLGREFITGAARMLAPRGRLLLVANRHLPYEGVLREAFRTVQTIAEEEGFKLFEAVR